MTRRDTFTAARNLPGQVPAFPRDAAILRAVTARARAAFPAVRGVTHVTADAAVFQVTGDPVRYCVRVTAEEAAALGFIKL